MLSVSLPKADQSALKPTSQFLQDTPTKFNEHMVKIWDNDLPHVKVSPQDSSGILVNDTHSSPN